MFIHSYIRIYVQIYLYTYIHVRVCGCVRVCVCVCEYACIYIYTAHELGRCVPSAQGPENYVKLLHLDESIGKWKDKMVDTYAEQAQKKNLKSLIYSDII